MGNKNKKKSIHQKEWPDSPSETPEYYELLSPLKDILTEGYDFTRKQHSNFTYKGYNIGEMERFYFPTPAERLNSRWLNNDAKFRRTLLDNVLVLALQLGMEFGRRSVYDQKYSNKLLCDIIAARNDTVKKLRKELSQYDARFEKLQIPTQIETSLIWSEEDLIEQAESVETSDAKEA